MDSTATPTDETDASNVVDAARVLIFRVAGRVYACDVGVVREVFPLGHVTRLPGAPPFVPGLINVRGTIVTVIDAGMYLHGRPCRLDTHTEGELPGGVPSADAEPVMLVDMGGRAVGMLVDAVADVRSVRDDEAYERLDLRAIVARVVIMSEDE